MNSRLRMALTLSLAIVPTSIPGLAQTAVGNSPSSESRASDDSTLAADKGSRSSPATATKPELKPNIEQKIDLLQKQIDELQSELKAVRSSALADTDSSALRTAENTLVAGNGRTASSPSTPSAALASSLGSPGLSSSTAGQQPVPAEAAAPVKEISAQTTTKGEPFEGDWTWLNSNGHAVG